MLFCDHCGYETLRKDSILGHVKQHIPKQFREKFDCNICDAVFISKQQYRTHTAAHESKPESFQIERIFSCDLCARHFPSKIQLSKHKTKQHKNNRVECKICGRSLFDKYVYRNHMKKFHKGEIDESILTSRERGESATGWLRNVQEEVQVPKKRVKPTKPMETRICVHCGKIVNKCSIHSHMRRVHHDGSKKFMVILFNSSPL